MIPQVAQISLVMRGDRVVGIIGEILRRYCTYYQRFAVYLHWAYLAGRANLIGHDERMGCRLCRLVCITEGDTVTLNYYTER